MGYLFVTEGKVDPHITAAIDSNLLKANGSVWHKSSMKKKKYHVLESIQMQDGARAILRNEYLDINYI